jgi:hypothetical protein
MPDSTATGTGTLPPDVLSYGKALLGELEYGQTPDDPCTVVDLPVATFSRIAPAAADLDFLAHIREVDTRSGADSDVIREQHAVVIANRVPAAGGVARAFLVSLEGMSDYLPAADGTPSTAIHASVATVRLIVHRSWPFTVNAMDETLDKLLQGLNAGSKTSTLTLPISGDAPLPGRVAAALAAQAGGSVTAADATVLMQNALLMGYLPTDHHLRHGGRTVSFYRGPLVPRGVPSGTSPPHYSGPDAANAYDPQTGMFDVSYGAAWQLGRLLALQSPGMADQLHQWKRAAVTQPAVAAEHALLVERLGDAPAFTHLMTRRAAAIADEPPPLPSDVASWFGSLVTLQGVPFSYLVPDERMLPPESIRFFRIDEGWIDALIDGAFSIGRVGGSGQTLEAAHGPEVRRLARSAAGGRAANRMPTGSAPGAPVSGFLIRSQAVAGWPNLRVRGYRDTAATDPVGIVRIARLSRDTMLCLFDDIVATAYLREPPEQLHHGVEGPAGGYRTTLRSVTGGPGGIAPGRQYTAGDPPGPQPWAAVPVRGDGRTIKVSETAAAVQTRLTRDFGQSFPQGFTSAEFALELTQGIVEVEFTRWPA